VLGGGEVRRTSLRKEGLIIITKAFFQRQHPWFDAGILGLYEIAIQEGIDQKYNVEIVLNDDSVSLKAESIEMVKECVEECYEILASHWWNVSTIKQQADPKAVFYKPDSDEFELRAKRNPTPIPALFTKGTSWRFINKESAIDYKDLSPEMKKSVDEFIREHSTSLWGTSRKLLVEDPVCHKKIEFFPLEKGQKKICSVCGAMSSNCVDVSQPTYLLFASNTAAKSFNSEAREPGKVCWECEMLGKFAIESVSYHKSFDDLFVLVINSPNLVKAHQINKKIGYGSLLRVIKKDDFNSNIRYEGSLIQFTKLPYEFLWAFFTLAYETISENMKVEQEKEAIDVLEELLHMTLDQSPVEIILFMISSKGQTFMTKEIINYNEPAYAFRLLHLLSEYEIPTKALFNQLWVKDEKDRYSLFRNKFFRKVLYRKSILTALEEFAFHQSLGKQDFYLADLLKFVMKYEIWVRGVTMTEQQIEIAVNLGKSIVLQARETIDNQEEIKKIKGDLFALRKTRTKEAFLNQLNTLQMRYGLIVSNALQDGIMNQTPFDEFKAYCLLGALNTYNSINKVKKGEEK